MSKKSQKDSTNYQTVEINASISAYKRGDVEIVDIDSPFWSNHYLAGNISIISVPELQPSAKVDDSYYEDDEAYD